MATGAGSEGSDQRQKGLRQRHMTMISLGGVTGAGLFVREAPDKLTLKMWGFPWLTYLSITGMVAVIGAMALVDDVRSQLWWSLGSLAVVLGIASWHTESRPAGARPGATQATGR